MHSFKKILLRVLLITTVLYFFHQAAVYLYEPVDEVSYYMNGELKQAAGKIDTLFCGTSTAYRGFSPQIWDQEMGGCSFNIATASQSLEDNYAFLKQEAGRNPVKRVFLGVSPKGIMKEENSLLARQRVFDSLSGPFAKLGYLMEHSDLDEWLYLAFYPVRVEEFFDFKKIGETLEIKRTENYKNFVFTDQTYKGKGFFEAGTTFKGKFYQHIQRKEGGWDREKINKREEKYLRKIIEFCGDKEIELILVWIPLSSVQIKNTRDAEAVHNYFNSFAEEYGVQFWDFMHYKELKTVFTNDKFKDKRHLNGKGGELFSRTLIDIYKASQNGDDLGEYFGDMCPYYQ